MVTFGDVEIREYPIVLSTNPATKYGPAIELGWEFEPASEIRGNGLKHIDEQQGKVPVNVYEDVRPSSERRDVQSLYLYLPTREYRLKKGQYTEREIEQAVQEKNEIYKRRERNNNCMRNPFYIVRQIIKAERRQRKIKRAIRNLKKQKKRRNNTRKNRNIYSGWWLPLSGHIF